MTIGPEEDLFGWMQEREIIRLKKALRDVLGLAEVLYEGDPWFAEDADMDADAILARGRAAVSGETPE